jgi:vancomycin resistance protein VanJ
MNQKQPVSTALATTHSPRYMQRPVLLIRIASNLFRILAGSYGVSIAGFLALRALIGETWALIGFLNNFLHLLLMPSLILLPLSLLLRRKFAALTQVPAALAFLMTYAPLFLPRSVEASAENPFTVLTYNLHAEADELDAMVALIRAANADIVAVQEVSAAAAERLPIALADIYPYMALYPGETYPTQGQGILSRYPIVEERYWRNTQLAHNALGHLRALLDVNDVRVVFYNAHPVHPGMGNSFYDDAVRGAEIDLVLEMVAQETQPVLILGDFNMGEQSDDYARIIDNGYTDVYRAVASGFGFTFPEWSRADTIPGFQARALPLPPLLRLDYVFARGICPLSARVWDTTGGSDHHPLFVTLGF